jgi:hypothetical protein
MLTIQYIPYQQIASLSSIERVQTILSLLKNGKVVIIDGRLNSSDEALLIRETMSLIDDEFNGVEVGVMRDNIEKDWLSKIKHGIAKALIGDRNGMTLIGPAKIISELRQHPENIELYFQKDYLIKHSKPQASNRLESNANKKSIKNKVK